MAQYAIRLPGKVPVVEPLYRLLGKLTAVKPLYRLPGKDTSKPLWLPPKGHVGSPVDPLYLPGKCRQNPLRLPGRCNVGRLRLPPSRNNSKDPLYFPDREFPNLYSRHSSTTYPQSIVATPSYLFDFCCRATTSSVKCCCIANFIEKIYPHINKNKQCCIVAGKDPLTDPCCCQRKSIFKFITKSKTA